MCYLSRGHSNITSRSEGETGEGYRSQRDTQGRRHGVDMSTPEGVPEIYADPPR